jgi:hypothetical protein
LRAENKDSKELTAKPSTKMNVVPISTIFVTVMMEALHFSETSVDSKATWRNIPKDGILQSNHSENLKSYIALTGWVL